MKVSIINDLFVILVDKQVRNFSIWWSEIVKSFLDEKRKLLLVFNPAFFFCRFDSRLQSIPEFSKKM